MQALAKLRLRLGLTVALLRFAVLPRLVARIRQQRWEPQRAFGPTRRFVQRCRAPPRSVELVRAQLGRVGVGEGVQALQFSTQVR